MWIDSILGSLNKVNRTGVGSWIVCRTALAVRLLEDGRIFLHRFGGCSIQAVMAALSIDFADLSHSSVSFRSSLSGGSNC